MTPSIVNRTPVSSSMMTAVSYDAERYVLEIEFVSGGTYQYLNVPNDVFEALLAAPSKGQFFHAYLDGPYAYRRISRARRRR